MMKERYLMRLLPCSLVLLALLLTTASSQVPFDHVAETEQIGGREYYVVFPDTVANVQDDRFSSKRLGDPEDYVLLIYSPVEQTVRIGQSGGQMEPVSIAAHQTVEYDLRLTVIPMTTPNRPSEKVVHVEAASPIVLYAYMSNPFGTVAFTPLPVGSWGNKYFAAAWPADHVENIRVRPRDVGKAPTKVPAPAQIVVIASQDETVVDFLPTGPLADCNGCTSVTLDGGESYMITSIGDTTAYRQREGTIEIAGTVIRSNKPIGVISGNSRTAIGDPTQTWLNGNSRKDQTAEWLRPVELHGTEFVHTLVFDQLRYLGVDFDRERGREFLRIYPTFDEQTVLARYNVAGQLQMIDGGAQIDPSDYFDLAVDNFEAGSYRASGPAQAFIAPNSHAAFRGTTGSGQFVGSAYDTWGSGMVELMPRAQWSSFAAFRAPSVPATTRHFVNLVTDTNSRFSIRYGQADGPLQGFPLFYMIPGTDLVWGSVMITAGTSYIVEGTEGARFSGYVYGNDPGYELDRDPRGGIAESYEEIIAEFYAYPLPGIIYPAVEPNDHRVTVEKDSCGVPVVTIESRNGSPVQLRYLRLASDSTANTRIDFIEPTDPRQLADDTVRRIVVRISPVNPGREAIGHLLWRDRSRDGQIEEHAFSIRPRQLTPTAAHLGISASAVGTQGDGAALFINRTTDPVEVRRLRVANGVRGFSIASTIPEIPWNDPSQTSLVAPGDTLRVLLRYVPATIDFGHDTLQVEMICGTVMLPLAGSVRAPCLRVGDLDFGQVLKGESRTLELSLCNDGATPITFVDATASGGGDRLSWRGTVFEVPHDDFDVLRDSSIAPGTCRMIRVLFVAEDEVGTYQTTARFWNENRECVDRSVWIGRIVDSISGVEDHRASGRTDGRLDLTTIHLDRDGQFRLAVEVSGLQQQNIPITIRLFDMRGRLVVPPIDRAVGTGTSRFEENLGDLPSGPYLVEIGQEGIPLLERKILVL